MIEFLGVQLVIILNFAMMLVTFLQVREMKKQIDHLGLVHIQFGGENYE